MDRQGKNWCFTIFDFTDATLEELTLWDCRYMIVGKEVCPTTGRPHLQCFVIWNKNMRFAAVKKLHATCKWSLCDGSAEQNRTYCSKEGNFTERGDFPISKRKAGEIEQERWKVSLAAAKSGDYDAIPPDIMVRYVRNLEHITAKYRPKPVTLDVLDCHWYFGETGTGKTRTATTENPEAYVKGAHKWWDRYEGEECVIIDEWYPDCEKDLAHLLKTWADHYPFQAEFKGGMKLIRPKKLIVTSNWSLEQCFVKHQNRDPLLRRFVSREFFLSEGQ